MTLFNKIFLQKMAKILMTCTVYKKNRGISTKSLGYILNSVFRILMYISSNVYIINIISYN